MPNSQKRNTIYSGSNPLETMVREKMYYRNFIRCYLGQSRIIVSTSWYLLPDLFINFLLFSSSFFYDFITYTFTYHVEIQDGFSMLRDPNGEKCSSDLFIGPHLPIAGIR